MVAVGLADRVAVAVGAGVDVGTSVAVGVGEGVGLGDAVVVGDGATVSSTVPSAVMDERLPAGSTARAATYTSPEVNGDVACSCTVPVQCRHAAMGAATICRGVALANSATFVMGCAA